MSKLTMIRFPQSLSRVISKNEHKSFSTLNARAKCNNRIITSTKDVNKVNYFVSDLKNVRYSSLAGPVRDDNVLYSPYGDVYIPKQNLTEYIFEYHEKFANHAAITCGSTGRSYTYGMCRMMIKRCAKALIAALHLQPGDTVGLILPNIPEFAIVINGAFEAGLKVTFANPLYTEEEILRQFINADVKCIITFEMMMAKCLAVSEKLNDYKGTILIGDEEPSKKGVHSLKALLLADYQADLPKIDVDQVALVPYSSGTTGVPKGVQLTHKNLVVNLEQVMNKNFTKPNKEYAKKYPMQDNGRNIMLDSEDGGKCLSGNHDSVFTVPPFFHIYGFNGILNYNLRMGNHIISIPRFTPEEYLNCLRKYKPKSLFVVPSLLSLLATHPMVTKDDLSSIEEIVIGAAPTTESIVEKFLNKCGKTREQLKLQQGFGMTECSPVATLSPYISPYSKVVSVGQLIPGTEGKVVSLTDGKNLGSNLPGELMIRGPQVMKGYLKNEEATKETIDDEGWLHTGDVAYYDDDHFFYIVDRTKELIKVKGNQVSPTELENIIMEMSAVADAAVVGIPDHLAGELPKAFVVLKKGSALKESEVYDWVKGKVVKYKRLDGGIVFIDSIPRNPGGKVMRNELKVLGGKMFSKN